MSSPATPPPRAPRICPQCEGERTFAIRENRIECRRCGYALRRDNGQPIKAADMRDENSAKRPQTATPRRKLQATFGRAHKGEIDRWADAAFGTAMLHVSREEWDEALKAFYRAIDAQHDFIDAHYWVALLVDDVEKKREHLSVVLANQPNHGDAQRELMILNGDLTEAEAAVATDLYAQPERVQVEGAVAIQTQNLRCPRCNSPNMTIEEDTGIAVCTSCGHRDTSTIGGPGGVGSLMQALLKRRSQAVQWVIGERLLACNSCGAERTIPARKLSEYCPFCGSNHIIEKDVLESFQQPDSLIPFMVKPDEAKALIKNQLGSWQERFKGWFNNNNVERASLEGVFLPFWMFDATVEVRRTIHRDHQNYSRDANKFMSLPGYESYVFADAMYNIEVCAVASPPPTMTRRLGDYHLADARAYTPKMLARFPAEIYSVDFDKASLQAREIVSRRMRQKHRAAATAESASRIDIFPSVQTMTFQLVLMPVWVATLHEEDGDVRTALINGQTGKVVLGKARKPDLINE